MSKIFIFLFSRIGAHWMPLWAFSAYFKAKWIPVEEARTAGPDSQDEHFLEEAGSTAIHWKRFLHAILPINSRKCQKYSFFSFLGLVSIECRSGNFRPTLKPNGSPWKKQGQLALILRMNISPKRPALQPSIEKGFCRQFFQLKQENVKNIHFSLF